MHKNIENILFNTPLSVNELFKTSLKNNNDSIPYIDVTRQ